MLQTRSIQSSLGLRDKILSIDYILVISILILGIISMFAIIWFSQVQQGLSRNVQYRLLKMVYQ